MAWTDTLRARAAAVAEALRALPPTPERATVFPAYTRREQPVDELASTSPQNIVSIYREADYGRTRRLIDAGKSGRKKDSRLDGVAAMRVTVIGSRRWVVKPAFGYEKDKLHLRRVAQVTQMLSDRRIGFAKRCQDLAHGVLEPHAVLEHAWFTQPVTVTLDGITTTEVVWNSAPQWRHPRRFLWNDRGELAKWDTGDRAEGFALSAYPGKFIVHTPIAGRSDYPWMRGALRVRLIGSIAKRSGVKWWLSALERYGQPQIIASVQDGDTNLVDAALAALRRIGPDWRAVVPKGIDFTTLEATVQSDLHQKFVDWQNTEDAVHILGQNLSTEVKGGSYAAAVSQERVRADILGNDLTELDETIDDQWLAVLWHFNWPGEPVGSLQHQLSAATPWTIGDYQAGLCTADEYRADNGHDPEANGRGDRYFVGPAQVTPTGGGPVAALPFPQPPLPWTPPTAASATPTSSTLPSTTHPLRSALLRR